MIRTGAFDRPVTARCAHPVRYLGEPRGYVAWFDWIDRKLRSYVQERCPHCGRYAILRSRRTGRLHPRGVEGRS